MALSVCTGLALALSLAATTTAHDPSGPERLPPIPEAQMTDAQRSAAAEIVKGPRGAVAGPFVPLLRSPELMSRLQRTGEYLRFRTSVPPKLNELAILVTSRHWSQAYELATHAPLARKAGLGDATVDAIRAGRRPERLSPDEATVYDYVTELLDGRAVSDVAYAKALALLGEQGVVELTVTVGYFDLIAMVLNVARTPPPPSTPAPEIAR